MKSTPSCWRGWKLPGCSLLRRPRHGCLCGGSISTCLACRRRDCLRKSKSSKQAAGNRIARRRSRELVDRLLASPHYGERWGRHWLDVARYSDGHGGALDNAALANAWRYRDWVVEALNDDLPFDEFIRRQLAGDLIAPEHAVATGFLAVGPSYVTDGGDPESEAIARADTLDDRVDTVSRGLLGVTVSCARCHDHKFDPIPQLDYYSLAGVFRNTKQRDVRLPRSREVVKAYERPSAARFARAWVSKIQARCRKPCGQERGTQAY